MQLDRTSITLRQFIISLLIASTLLISYEFYWRDKGQLPSSNMSSAFWAKWRRQVDNLNSDDIIILGSSRAFFNINLHLFEELSGKKPIMLAIEGGTPRVTLEDIVRNTDFDGLILCGVSGDLFYTTSKSWTSKRVQNEYVKFAEEQTLASRFNESIFKYLDQNLAYIDYELSLKKLIEVIPIPARDSVWKPVLWPQMVTLDEYRSARMTDLFERDTALQNIQKTFWFEPGEELDTLDEYADSTEAILNFYASQAESFVEKGGRIAFFQSPVSGPYYTLDTTIYPREKYWDELLRKAKVPGYHYRDYPESRDMIPPEWSHLNKKDADDFTRLIVRLLKKDGLI